MVVPLKITTDYSLLKSCIKVENLIPFLKENHITSAAIVDENLYGVMEFYNACQKQGIKPIIGLELEYNDRILYAYAKDYRGYQNLLKLHTKKEQKNLTKEDWIEYKNHLKIILPFSYLNDYEEMKTIWEEVWIGYQTDWEKNNALMKTSQVVYVRNIRAFDEKNTELLDYLTMIDQGLTKKTLEQEDHSYHFFDFQEIEEEDEQSSIEFSKDIHIEIEKNKQFIPHYDNKIENSYEYLVALSKKGLQKRLENKVSEEYSNRLKYELETIEKMGFADYFLIVYDYVLYAKKNGILVGPGRGSAAGSLVSYCLGITDVDPIKYHLFFERFLNIERITMPDIDIDFEYTKRGQVIDYVKEKYGKENVAGIMTFGTLGSKMVLRDMGRCLELNIDIINKILAYIDPKKNLTENLENPAVRFYIDNNEEIKNWYQISQKIEGIKRHISTHAAGIVISSSPLDTVIPICYSGGEMLTGVTMSYLEELGLLKMDFLALRNLTIIQNVLELIERDTSQKIELNKIDLNDSQVLKLFHRADTSGIFQFESVGMINFLSKLKPNCFLDLVAALALYRPGPMDNIDSFIRRKEGKEAVEYLHKDLEPILKDTYGIIVYQEQIMQILSKIGGFTFAESDNIRRAMSKKKKEIIEEYREKFIKGAMTKGYNKQLAEKVYDLIEKFANYGFNKAHSVSYALIGYQMAYLKVNYPIYYIANLLNMSINSVEKTKEYLMEAKKRNYQIYPPNINVSTKEYQILKNGLMLPLSAIKNLGSESTETILKERNQNGDYKDFFQFVARTYGKSVNRKTIENLIDAGAFYQMEPSYASLKENIDSAINYATLVSDLDESFVMQPVFKTVEKEEVDNRTRELEMFGFYLSNHPSSKYTDSSIMKLENIKNHFDAYVTCVVTIENIRRIETKKKEPMAFLSGSDETQSADFVVFKNAYSFLTGLTKNDFVKIEGKVTKRFDNYQINVMNITKL